MSTTINLGRVTPVFQGNWNDSTSYSKLDVVYYSGSSYIARTSNSHVTPGTNANVWQIIAIAGSWSDFTNSEKQDILNELRLLFDEQGYLSVDEINAQVIKLGGVDISEAITQVVSITVGSKNLKNF